MKIWILIGIGLLGLLTAFFQTTAPITVVSGSVSTQARERPSQKQTRKDQSTFANKDPEPQQPVFAEALRQALSGTEESYQSAIRTLRNNPNAAGDLIDAYASTSHGLYQTRGTLVFLMSDLRTPETLPAFRSILETPVAEERPKEHHGHHPYIREMTIYTAAVDGLEILARGGDDEARSLLIRSLEHPEFSVRRAAVQALFSLSEDPAQAKEEIRKSLKAEEYYLLDLRRDAHRPAIDGIDNHSKQETKS